MSDGGQTAALRRRRRTQLAGALVTAILIGGVVVGLMSAGSSTGIPASSARVAAIVSAVDSLIGGIPQSGSSLGSPEALVTVEYFGDLECPTCREFTLGALPALIRRYVRSGKLRIEYRSLQTATSAAETFKTQQVAALAAGRQDRMWTFLELFYSEQGEEGTSYVSDSYLMKLAKQVPGLDVSRWMADRKDPELAASLAVDARAAGSARLTSTPTFLIGRTAGALHHLEYDSLGDPSSFDAAIERELRS